MIKNIEIPKEIYTYDKACGEFIFLINQRLAKLREIEAELNAAKKLASEAMLDRLSALGQKHFAFEGLGTFKKQTTIRVSGPTAEEGGREAIADWLTVCLERGVIIPAQLLDIQQARYNADPVLAIEQAVGEYNQRQKLNGNADLIPPSPFKRVEQTTLSTPHKRKA